MKERTMTKFEAITTQEEFDERIKARLAREREKWEKESDTEDLKTRLEAKEAEIVTLQKTHSLEWELAKRGLDTPLTAAKVETIKSLIDLDSETDPAEQLDRLETRVPELFQVPQGTGSGYFSKTPALDREKPLTEEDVSNMSESEINSNWERVKGFLAGERS
jgi:predicted RNase H-like nuclease (RuvC/YqgF family)